MRGAARRGLAMPSPALPRFGCVPSSRPPLLARRVEHKLPDCSAVELEGQHRRRCI